MRRGTADTPPALRASWWSSVPALAVVLLAAHLYFHSVYPNFTNPNVLSRAYVAMSLAEKGSFTIDSYVLRYGDTQDKARYQDHYYSDKPPGSALLLAPVALVLRFVLPAGVSLGTRIEWLRVLGLSIPLVLFWLACVKPFESWCGDRRRAIALVLAGALGTHFFLYATAPFAHAPAAVLVFFSFLLFDAARRSPNPDGRPRMLFFAGLLLAYAFICDFILLVAVIAFGSFVLYSSRRRPRAALAFAAGCLPPLLLLLAYNYACFDSPFKQGFHFHADALYGREYNAGFLGIHSPNGASWLGMTFLPERGIFFFSPMLLLGFYGYARMLREKKERASAVAALLLIAGTCLFTTTTIDWKGGWAASMRYLVPVVPLLLLGVARAARGVERVPWLSRGAAGLFLVGLFHVALTASSFPYFPAGFVNPVYNFCLPLLRMGGITAALFGWSGLASVWGFAGILTAAAAMFLACWFSGSMGARVKSMLVSVALAAVIVLIFSTIHEPAASARGRIQAFSYVLERMGVAPGAPPRADAGRARKGPAPPEFAALPVGINECSPATAASSPPRG